jgi:hypothetical protein
MPLTQKLRDSLDSESSGVRKLSPRPANPAGFCAPRAISPGPAPRKRGWHPADEPGAQRCDRRANAGSPPDGGPAFALESCCALLGTGPARMATPKDRNLEAHMSPQRPDSATQSRRHETIAGCKVTLIKRGPIETVRGGPKCRWCGKPLRPKYLTERAAQETRHYYDKKPKHVPATFDEKRQQWVVVSTAFRVVRRLFQGSFGAYGDNFFCGLNCGRDYAVAVTEAIDKGRMRLVGPSGTPITISAKGTHPAKS